MKRGYINRGYTVLSIIVSALFVSALFTRCANIGSPSGGPKDSLPPTIVAMTPENFTTEIDPYTRRIYIEFDEFVQLKNQQTEFYTSPQMKNKPQLSIRGRGVVVTLRDTLLENTTYALDFGSSIQDNNESNPLYSMRYVFSTGKSIDSMMMSGYAEDSFSADSVSKAFIMMYHADSITLNGEYDSTLFNAKPSIIARAENNGIFIAQNLKPVPYRLYAVMDTNGNQTYEPGTDKVGFIDGLYNPAEMSEFTIWRDSLRKYMVAEPQTHFRLFLDKPFRRQLLVDSERPIQHMAKLYFGAEHPQIDSIIFDSLATDQVIVEYLTEGRDTLSLWFNAPKEQIPDTLRGRIVYFKHDSIRNLSRVSEDIRLSWRYIESREEQQARERQEREMRRLKEGSIDSAEIEEIVEENPFKIAASSSSDINPEQSIYFDFEYPLARLDSAAITLQYLSPQAVELRNKINETSDDQSEATPSRGNPIKYNLYRDSVNVRRWHIDTTWGDVGSEYYLTIPKGAITDIAGFSNDNIKNEYSILNKEKYATIVVNIVEDETSSSDYILDLMSGKKILESKTGVGSGTVTFNYVPAGSVTLRVIEDINRNGKWDNGDLIKRIQPERVKYVEENGERSIATKINWEIELTVDPAKMFATESQADLAERLAREERQRIAKLKSDESKAEGRKSNSQHQH